MANTLEFAITSFASDLDSGVLTDQTTYGTPARADVGVFVSLQKINADSSVDGALTIIGDDGDADTDSVFTFDITKDGWHRFSIVALPDYAGGTTYAIYDAVFDPSSGKGYRSKQNGNTGNALGSATWWEEIASPGLLALNNGEANESANIDSLVYEVIIPIRSQQAYAERIASTSEEYLTSLRIPNELLASEDLFASLVNSMAVRSDRGEYSRGERIARRLDSIIETL